MCGLRKLNARTVKDSYTIPCISETLQALSRAEWFCSLDLQSGYPQVTIACKDKPKTAMTTPFGLYEFDRMPFGWTNAPVTFQRLMECCLGDSNFRTCLIYLDDVIVLARSFPEMLQRLEEVLQRPGEYGLKLKMSKYKLFQRKLTYLGQVVSAAGVEPDPEKTIVLEDWCLNPPKNSQQLQTFLGFAGYYRSFVKNFAKIAEPLYHLVGGRPPRGRKTPPFLWTERCQEAFECLISCLTSPPILATLTSNYPSQCMSMPVAQDWVPLYIKLRKDGPLSSPTAAGHCPLLRGTIQLTAENSSPLNGLLLLLMGCCRQQPFNLLGDLGKTEPN